MKRTFLAKRNALLSSASISWGVLALAFALLALAVRLFAPDFFFRALAPAYGIADAVTAQMHAFTSGFADTAALAKQNEQLSRQNAALASENAALLAKIADVSGLFGASGEQEAAGEILAGVVARPPVSPYDTLLVAAGKSAGVTLGMEAFGEGGVPLGAVSAVTDEFSRVTLFSSPGRVTHGWVGRAAVPVDLYGAGAGAFTATLSRSADVGEGDTVFVPGPGMLPIGTLVRVDSDPSSPSLALRIAPAVSPFSITWVALRDTGAAFLRSFSEATSTP